MEWIQKEIRLSPKPRGFHLISSDVTAALPELSRFNIGMVNLFLKHTSASLSINENADPDVRSDLEMAVSKIVPENFPYQHTCEGPDDMPAHIKSSFIGVSLSIPIQDGRLALGTWQGIYLCEHRDHGGSRKILATIQGSTR